LIPRIATLPPDLQDQVHIAFASSLSRLWQVLIGIAAMGFLSSLIMKALPLHTQLDKEWAMTDRNLNEADDKAQEPLATLSTVG
jgi:hypothetical protein